jgi:hypothetical protein
MLVGYNTNVPYKGKIYHVQTEDNGIRNPVIITLLYFKGRILASKKINYSHLADSPDYEVTVRELMKEQHKTIIKELIRGRYTGDKIPESPEEKIPPAKSEKPSRPESGSKCQISKSLDDILLEFIIKKGT